MDEQLPTGDRRPSACIGCGATEGRSVLSFTEAGTRRSVRRCAACHHHFLDGWDHTYDVALYDYYAPRLGLPKEQLYDALTTDRLRRVLGRLRPPGGGRLLDVGCGEGQLVDAARSIGFDARGIDVAEPAIAICRSFGLPCATQDLFAPELDGARFDVITLVETIEHVPDPTRMLSRVHDLLIRGGVVWLTTPNLASLGRRILGERWPVLSQEHLSYFTPTSLLVLARRAGFDSAHVGSRTLSAAALRTLLRRPPPTAVDGPGALASPGFAAEQRLRHRMDEAPLLRATKAAVNAALSASRLGETLVAELRVG